MVAFLWLNQNKGNIVHIGASGAGENKAVHSLQAVVGIVSYQDFRDLQALCLQFPFGIPVGIASGGIRGAVGSV